MTSVPKSQSCADIKSVSAMSGAGWRPSPEMNESARLTSLRRRLYSRLKSMESTDAGGSAMRCLRPVLVFFITSCFLVCSTVGGERPDRSVVISSPSNGSSTRAAR